MWLPEDLKLCTLVTSISFGQQGSRAEFRGLSTLDILDWLILSVVGNCPGHCQLFNSIPGLDLLGASSIASPLWVLIARNISRRCCMFLEGIGIIQVENHLHM